MMLLLGDLLKIIGIGDEIGYLLVDMLDLSF